MDFDTAFTLLIGNEGGYTNDPRDPGGETMYGISKRSYPTEDIKNMTLGRAKWLYQRDYWGPAGCDVVPDGIKFDLFDMAVNSGVKNAVKALQKAVSEIEDGVLGGRTVMAVQSMDAMRLVARFNGARLLHLTSSSTWVDFGKGLVNRVANNLLKA